MPASEAREDERNVRIFTTLFWVGVGLAPLAALMLLIGSSMGSLRAAVGILILSVILIGVSVILRREGETVRGELEDTVYGEIDAVRRDMRDDIAHAAQATHRALGEKMQYLLDQLEATRADLESLRHHALPAGPSRANGLPAGQRQGIPPGVVRHTETVQVTTRHTVMDPHEETRGAYGRPPAGIRGAQHRDRDREESWTDQRLRDQVERRREINDWQPDAGFPERWAASSIDDDDDRRPGVRTGDRWASVRSDENGRELRMGERRAAMHSDAYGGTELRIEDRWAAVRREAGLDRPGWEEEEGYGSHRDRRAITGGPDPREERWSDYRDERYR